MTSRPSLFDEFRQFSYARRVSLYLLADIDDLLVDDTYGH